MRHAMFMCAPTRAKMLGRVDLDTLKGLENWTPPKDLVNIIVDLKEKGRL
jgi:hypothetical protein